MGLQEQLEIAGNDRETHLIPGGKREERDSTLQQTALRELRNCTGLRCEDWMDQLKDLSVKTGKETTYHIYELQERVTQAVLEEAFGRRDKADSSKTRAYKWSDELSHGENVRREDAQIIRQLATSTNQQLNKFNLKTKPSYTKPVHHSPCSEVAEQGQTSLEERCGGC